MRRLHAVIVWIADTARATMLREARARPRTETGGGLFGYVAGDATVVEHAGIAGGRTRRGPTRLEPDPDDLQAQIDRLIADTDGARYLVGEWHTHPWGRPKLSVTDTTSLRRTAENPAVGLPRPLAIIVVPRPARARPRFGVHVWDPSQGTAVTTDPVFFRVRRGDDGTGSVQIVS